MGVLKIYKSISAYKTMNFKQTETASLNSNKSGSTIVKNKWYVAI